MAIRTCGGGVPLLLLLLATLSSAEFLLLDPEDHRDGFVEGFPGPFCNGTGAGQVNESTFEWAKANLPFFETSDKDIERTYYFRAKTYKSHLIPTDYADLPYAVSEFGLSVHWGGPYGTINAAAGHHISEGRWLRDPTYMDSVIKWWVGSLSGGNAQLTPHFANGTVGKLSGTPYSTWILTAALKRAQVKGDLTLGKDHDGKQVDFAGVLQSMVSWWEKRTLQTRLDCSMAAKNKDPGFEQCFAKAPGTFPYPFCYIVDDGWDAMEGSVSGDGCRPTVGAMKYGDALAIAAFARVLGNTSLAQTFEQRAAWVQQEYLRLLWNDKTSFFSVYKENLQGNGKYNCVWPPNHSHALADSEPHHLDNCPPKWNCNETVGVRELLGLGPPYYFNLVPQNASGASKYDTMWQQLWDTQGFAAKFGPTTVERRHRCFNQTQDEGECNWAGPSWPYETSRVLTGLSNFLIDYPTKQTAQAMAMGSGSAPAVPAKRFVDLLRTYATTHTQSNATNGSSPWVGENVEPDKGYWMARHIMYQGGQHPAPVNCAACRTDPRPRNCGGRTDLPPCCDAKGADSCDGKVIPTPDKDRGKDYNHSTFLDIIIAGLVGLRAAFGAAFAVQPLVDSSLSYFALDNLAYHGHNLTIAYDPAGTRGYAPKGSSAAPCRGLCVWVDGKLIGSSPTGGRLNLTLPGGISSSSPHNNSNSNNNNGGA